MATKKITDLVVITSADSTDLLPIVDVSANTTKKVTVAGIASAVADSIPSNKLTNAMLSTAAGEIGGSWTPWTPTWTNLTVGNGTVEAKYIRIGKMVHCSIRFTMGSTSVMGPDPTFTLPVTASSRFSAATRHNLGSLYLEDAGVAGYLGDITSESTTTARPRIANVAGTWLAGAPITSAQPMVWAASDFFAGVFTYEAA